MSKSTNLVIKQVGRAYLPNRIRGEDTGVIDINGDGFVELFWPIGSNRNPEEPLLNQVAVFTLKQPGGTLVMDPLFTINTNSDSFTSIPIPTVAHDNSRLQFIGGPLQSGYLQDIEYADFNGDRKTDLLISGHGKEWAKSGFDQYNHNDFEKLSGNLDFLSKYPGEEIQIVLNGESPKIINVSQGPGFFHQAAIGDIDGDKDIDIVATNLRLFQNKWTMAYLNSGDAQFTSKKIIDESLAIQNLGIGDFDGNGISEILVAPTDDLKSFFVYEYESSGNFIRKYSIPLPIYDKNIRLVSDKIAVGDFNRDGKPDFAVSLLSSYSFADGYFGSFLYLNTGKAFEIVAIDKGNKWPMDGPEFSDVDNDGDVDVIFPGWTFNNNIDSILDFIYINQGDNSFVSLSGFVGDKNRVEWQTEAPGQDPRIRNFDVVNIGGKNYIMVQRYGPSSSKSDSESDLLILSLQFSESNQSHNVFTFSGLESKITGSSSIDRLIVPHPSADFLIKNLEGTTSVQLENKSVLSNLYSIERLQFTDKTIAFDIDGNAGQTYRVYKAAFNRTPDNGGLKYWIQQMDGGKKLSEVASGFIASNEFKSLYGANPTSDQFVAKLYSNVLGRSPDAGGFNYWVGLLNNKQIDMTSTLVNFSESTENQAGVIGVIQNGIELI